MTSRLQRLARRAPASDPAARSGDDAEARCDLCSAPIGPEHRHLLELPSHLLRCACRACTVVLGAVGAGGGRYRLIPERYRELPALAGDDARWADLRLPVSLAFLVRRESGDGLAVFPGALGPTDAPIDAERWAALESAYPEVKEMESEVEAVLVNRLQGKRECWLVPLDECYRLVALLRARWEGINGGRAVWIEIDRFFAQIASRVAGAPTRDAQEMPR
ncbi:MAG TPA: DUF5947 family protein [Gemmatimonadales bacterium]|nr:DUF5947 family protein [Gemmatimonadales bacterium]